MSNDSIVFSRLAPDQSSIHGNAMTQDAPVAYEPVPSAGLHPELVRRLLDNLERNQEFRAIFQASPEQALRSLGYQDPWVCLQANDKNRLASPEDIREQRQKIETVLTSPMTMDVFKL